MKDEEIEVLRYFHKGIFDTSAIVGIAQDRMNTAEIKRNILDEMANPSEDFVRCVARDLIKGSRSAATLKQIEQLKTSTKHAFHSIVQDVQSAKKTPLSEQMAGSTTDDTPSRQPTPEELEWFHTIRTALAIHCDCKPDRFYLREIQSGLVIHMNAPQRKTIAHLVARDGKTQIGVFDATGTRTLHPYDGVDTIFCCIQDMVTSVEIHTGKRERPLVDTTDSHDAQNPQNDEMNAENQE
jgi:hypothetical protein